jgi:hypothetical protein
VNNTNFFDVLVAASYLAFLLASFGGTAYLIQAYNWSPWWMLFAALVFGSVKIKTGI